MFCFLGMTIQARADILTGLQMQLEMNGTSGIQAQPGANSENFQVGDYQAGNSAFLSGKVEEVRIYTRALSSSDVTQLYDYTAPVANSQTTINNAVISNATIN